MSETVHETGAIEVPKEHCWHIVMTYRSVPSRRLERCCWCKNERTVERAEEDRPHGVFKP